MPTIKELIYHIESSSEGLSITEILDQLPGISRRTAQRWLSQLVDDGAIIAEGKARARVYKPILKNRDTNLVRLPNISSSASDSAFSAIPLSADSQDILNYVNQNIEHRKPVGYQFDFLEDYIPNHTFYLPTPLRHQLRRMGETHKTQLPAGTYGRDILNRLLIDLSWASSHLEGNTYSRLDTRHLIENGQTAKGKAALETQMILNHKAAIELLVDEAESIGFNRFTIQNLHSLLSENLLANPADEGRLRQFLVEISRSVYRPLDVPSQIGEQFDLVLKKADQIEDPFEQSFFIMVHLPYLQPFADVNKRTSRLAANLPLIRANLCPLTFLDVPTKAYTRAILGVYELTRIELLRDLYLWAYERSTQEYLAIQQHIAEPDPFRLQYRDLIKSTMKTIVQSPQVPPLEIIQQCLSNTSLIEKEQQEIESLIIEELRRLHEGVLSRYGLKPSEYQTWLEQQHG